MKEVLAFFLLFSFLGSNGNKENAHYDSNHLPEWIIEEWSNAQDEILELDNLMQDPRRFSPENWQWMQIEEPFMYTDEEGKRKRIRGLTDFRAGRIIICCGDKEVIHHEAFHAILWQSGDDRFKIHYPDLKKEIEKIRKER